MDRYMSVMDGVKQACIDTKRTIARFNELNELMAQGKFAEADQLMAELEAQLAELKAK